MKPHFQPTRASAPASAAAVGRRAFDLPRSPAKPALLVILAAAAVVAVAIRWLGSPAGYYDGRVLGGVPKNTYFEFGEGEVRLVTPESGEVSFGSSSMGTYWKSNQVWYWKLGTNPVELRVRISGIDLLLDGQPSGETFDRTHPFLLRLENAAKDGANWLLDQAIQY